MRRLERKKRAVAVIRGYLRSRLSADNHYRVVRNVLALQRAIRLKLSRFQMRRKLQNMTVLQAYIKKEAARRNRLRYTRAL